MNHLYEENLLKKKDLENKYQRELCQNSPKTLTYETESALSKENVFKDIYAGIDLFHRLIREAKQELESKKLHYKPY